MTSDATLGGTAEPGGIVTLSENGMVFDATRPDANGHCSFDPRHLADGQHTIVASESDSAGNT